MSKLPESVKIARVGMVFADTLEGERFNVIMGEDEVMVLLSLYFWWYGTLAVGKNTLNVGLWRKSDENPGSVYTASPDMVWARRDAIEFVTESIKEGDHEHVVFPQPLVLIRPPRMISQKSTFTTFVGEMRLYYRLVKVSDEELARLMVKDHA